MKQHFSSLKRSAYRILKADPKEAIEKANEYIRKHPSEIFDLVIFDFPGHAGTSDLLQLSLEMDYILSPLEPDVQSMVASLTYIKAVNDLGVSMPSVRIKEVILLWNKVDRRVKNTLIEYYNR